MKMTKDTDDGCFLRLMVKKITACVEVGGYLFALIAAYKIGRKNYYK